MSGTVSFSELDRQHGELLPARTVLSMFCAKGPDGSIPGGGDLGTLVTKFAAAAGLGGTSSGADGTNTEGTSGTDKS